MPVSGNIPENEILGSRAATLGRDELLRVAIELCGLSAGSEAGAHGAICPATVGLAPDGTVRLGPPPEREPGEWTTDEVQYMAPELFWGETPAPASDVYSVGMLLYVGVTRGEFPFCGGEPTDESFAAALRDRMNGERIAAPEDAGEKLGPVIEKALAFDRAERYAAASELAEALRACLGEGDALSR